MRVRVPFINGKVNVPFEPLSCIIGYRSNASYLSSVSSSGDQINCIATLKRLRITPGIAYKYSMARDNIYSVNDPNNITLLLMVFKNTVVLYRYV